MPLPQTTGEDRFVVVLLQLLGWAQRNTRALVLSVGAAAIVIFAVRYYVDYRYQVREAAATQMVGLRFQLSSGSAVESIEHLRAFLVQFSGTHYAREARVLLAHSLLLSNRAAEAIDPASQAMNDLGADFLSMRAAFLAAAAYEEVGDTSAAIDVYREIAQKVGMRVQQSRALEAAGRLLDARGDAAAAATVYEQLAEMTPEDAPARPFYEMRAAELRARDGSTSASSQELGMQEEATVEGG